MYTNNLIKAIRNLNIEDRERFDEYAYNYHYDQLGRTKLPKSEVEKYIRKFLTGNTTSLSFNNFNSFLYALDMLHNRGAQNALFNIEKQKQPNDWRSLLIKSTSDVSLPNKVDPLHLDDVNIAIFKNILKITIEIASGDSMDETTKNLKLMNEFMEMLITKMK